MSANPAAASPRQRASHGPAYWKLLSFLAWRNVWRNRARSVLTILIMVVSLTLLILGFGLMEGLDRQGTYFATGLNLGHLQLHRQEHIDSQELYALLPMELLQALEADTPYAYAPRLYAAGLGSSGEHSVGVSIKAIDPEREARVTQLQRHLKDGSFDLQTVRENADGVPVYSAVLAGQLARNLAVGVGAELVLITQAADGSIGNGLFRVAGILKPVDPGFDRSGVLLSMAGYQSLMFLEGGVHEIAVHLPDIALMNAAQQEIRAVVQTWTQDHPLPEFGGGVVVRRWDEINPQLASIMAGGNAQIAIVGLILFALAALAMVNTMLMAVHERAHEFGILLALGFGRLSLLMMVMLESLFLSVLASILGCITGGLWAWDMQVNGWDYSAYAPDGLEMMGVVFEPIYRTYMLPQHFYVSVLMLLGVMLLASLIPSWRTARLKPTAVLAR